MKRTYRLNLRGIGVRDFKKNPIVLWRYDQSILPVGRAVILKGKTAVEVDFPTNYPPKGLDNMTLATATYSYDFGVSKLAALSLIPILDLT